MIRKYFGKAVIRTRMMLEKTFSSILMMLIMLHMRNNAHRFRRQVVKLKGKKVVTRQVRKTIKEYCKRRFGKKSYWPFVAFNTEVRGEYVEGWIPYDYFRFKFLPKLNPRPANLIDFKTYDFQLFGDFAVRPLYLYINDMYYDADLNFVAQDQVLSFFSGYDGDIVIKEDTSWGGLKVKVMHASEYTPDAVKKRVNYVIQPYVEQHKDLGKIYPDSVNSIRVNTFLKKDGKVDVKCVWLRFGADGSRVDNVTSGGMYLFVHLDGKPEKWVYDVDTCQPISDRHKNTGFVFSEVEIPMFDEVLAACKKAHLKYPYTRLIAWDATVDSTGKPRLLEWNLENPDFTSAATLWGPFWPDDSDI